MTLFTIRLALNAEEHEVEYGSVDSALRDKCLAILLQCGAVASVWSGGLRVTRDLTDWGSLHSQLVNNAPTLLRRLEKPSLSVILSVK